jgi:lysophospholipase L1-like esterase
MAIKYNKQTWTDGVPGLSAARLGHMETGIKAAADAADAATAELQGRLSPTELNATLGAQASTPGTPLETALAAKNAAQMAPTVERARAAENLLRIGGAPSVTKLTAVAFGDSTVSQCSSQYNTAGATMRTYNALGWFTQMQVMLGHRLKLLKNAGMSGTNTNQWLARLDADLISLAPGWAFIGGPTNDVTAIANGSMTLATSKANMASIWDQCEAAGIRVVQFAITPRDAVSPQLADVPGQRAALFALNQWMREQSRLRPRIVFVDWYAELASGALMNWKAGHISAADASGLHPWPQGAYEMGRIAAERLAPVIPAVDILPASEVELANLVNVATGAALARGTGGTVGTGGSGQAATGWRVDPLPAASFTARKVARADGLPGDWQEVTVHSGTVKIGVNVSGYGTVYAENDEIYAIAEFETDPSAAPLTNGDFIRLNLVAMKPDFGVGRQSIDMDVPGIVGFPPAPYFPRKGVMLTPLVVVPATATLRMALQFEVKASSGARTVRVGRIGMYKKGTGPGADEWARSDVPLS